MRYAILVCALVSLVAQSAHGRIVAYPEYDARIERDYAYAVRVSQGAEKKRLVVYNHCEKSPLTRRTRGGDVNRRFCEFAFDGGPVKVDIAVSEDVESYAVFPSRLGLKSDFKNGVVSVWVERPCNFGIRLNDYDKTILSVFAEAPEVPAKVPQKGAPGVMYVEGWVDPPREDGVTFVEVLATFESQVMQRGKAVNSMYGMPAIIYGRYGKGKVLVSVMHPEYFPSTHDVLAAGFKPLVGRTVTFVSGEQIAEGALDHADVLLVPGGRRDKMWQAARPLIDAFEVGGRRICTSSAEVLTALEKL